VYTRGGNGRSSCVSLISIAAPNRVYQLYGFGEQGSTDLVNVNYRRDIQRDVVAGGGGLALRSGAAHLVLFGEVVRSDERNSSAESNDPPIDGWDADGVTFGAAAGTAFLQGRLELLGTVRSASLTGELSLDFEDDIVPFTADERRLDAALDARLRPVPGWQVAVRIGAENEARDRFDALTGMRLDLESWRSQFAAEVARDIGLAFSVAVGAGYEMYRAGGNVPAGPPAGYVYSNYLGPEFAYYGEDVNSTAASVTVRWTAQEDGAGVFLQVRTATTSAPGRARLPLTPTGSRTGLVLLIGAGSDRARESTGTASGEPQLPSPTHTLRANPARPERRSAEPRENASHAVSSSAVSSNAMSDGEAVPGCEHDAPGSSCTPNGGPPGARAANAGSDVACEKRRVNGHTSWEDCRLPRHLIVLPRGKRK
jgi:hypothetical protein